MLPISERLNNPQIVKVYRQMIENAPTDIVIALRENINKEAPDHAKTKVLEEYFIQRLGK